MRTVDVDVSRRIVRVDHSVGVGVFTDESLQRASVCGRYDFRVHSVRVTISDAYDGGFAHRAASRVQFLGLVLVALFAADVSLIDFDGAQELGRVFVPNLSDAVSHVPCARLRDTQVSMQFVGTHALEVRAVEIERYSPLGERDVGILHGSAGLDAEILAARVAIEGHGFARLLSANPVGIATRAT